MALTLTARAFAPLKTERLLLRPLRPEDAPALHNLVNDWVVVRNLSQLTFPYERALADKWIASTAEQMAQGTGYHLAIAGQQEGSELLGCVGLRLDMTPRVGNLGYWVGQRFWGHGVATEAVTRFARWALANLDIDRLEAHVAEDNPASAAVLRRAGFRQTGTGEAAFLARGGKHPVIRFGATRDDLFPPTDPAATLLSGSPDTDLADAPGASPETSPGPTTGKPPGKTAEKATGKTTGKATGKPPGKPIILVSAVALIDVDSRVLLARRPEGKTMAGLWEFPGGKVQPGETPEAALIRELREELGIDVAESCLAAFAFASHGYDRFHLLMPLYLCRRWNGRPEGREGQALAWVPPRRLADYPMPPADKPLIPLLRDFL